MDYEQLRNIKARAMESTGGETLIGYVDPEIDPAEWFRQHIELGTDPHIWAVYAADDPRAIGGDDPGRPEFAVITAITGNGPTSQSNAEFYASARADVLALIAEVERLWRVQGA